MSPPMHDSIISDLLSLVISAGAPILRQFCDRCELTFLCGRGIMILQGGAVMRFRELRSAEDIICMVEEIGFLPFFENEIKDIINTSIFYHLFNITYLFFSNIII